LSGLIRLYTDGSCNVYQKTNATGSGGWAYIFESDNLMVYDSGRIVECQPHTAELLAVIKAFRFASEHLEGRQVELITDNQGNKGQLDRVRREGHLKEAKPEDVNSWDEVSELIQSFELVNVRWEKRNSHPLLELCDRMAYTESRVQTYSVETHVRVLSAEEFNKSKRGNKPI